MLADLQFAVARFNGNGQLDPDLRGNSGPDGAARPGHLFGVDSDAMD